MSNDCELISFAGDLDITRVEELRSAVDAFRDSPALHAVVDLSDVSFFGSEGVGLIARLGHLARGRQGSVTLINASEAAVRVLSISGLHEVVRQERRFSPAPAARGWSAPAGIPAPRQAPDVPPPFPASLPLRATAGLTSSA